MNLTKLSTLLLYDFKSESDLVKAIEELSLNFTQKRENISEYLNDKRLASAYTAFYLTTNMPKLEAVFKWMPEKWLEKLKQSTLIDLGAGPGTFSLAFREWAGSPVKVVQIETSNTMREQAQKLWKGLYPDENLVQSSSGKINIEAEKFLLFGHSANEMGPEVAMKYVREINPDHILFIEPGTKDFFPKMLKIRDELLKDGFQILFPCPTASHCPLAQSTEDWCHQFIQIRQTSEIERLTQLAKKDRRNLPLTVHAFTKMLSIPNPSIRIVRVFAETKFSFEWEVCELNVVKHYQIMKRGMSKEVLGILSEALAGAALEVEVEKELENATRVKIKSLNNRLL